MKKSTRRWIVGLVAGVLAGTGAWWWLQSPGKTTPPTAAGPAQPIAGGATAFPSAAGTTSTASGPGRSRPAGATANLIKDAVARMDPGQPEANRWQLAALRDQLRKLPPGEAARQLRVFLDTGADAATGLRLRVGRGGMLETAPTLRVAALDWLAEFSPEAAVEAAKQVFAGSNSADEWALALRNYYQKTQMADAYFKARVAEALGREGWLQQPSAGLAESVDFPVAIGGADGYGILKALLQNSEQLRRPALAALDAWVMEERHTAITLLAAEATAPGGLDENSRAALLSRADLRDDAQRAAIQSYLESPGVPQEAKAEFLRQFPNHSMILGYHLVTTVHLMPLGESAAVDLAALDFVEKLTKAGTLPDLGKELAACHERLTEYVASARRGGIL